MESALVPDAEFGQRIQSELQLHDTSCTLVKLVLCGMKSAELRQETRKTSLPLLNQGKATALHYRQLIADFIGLPTGKRLRKLRNASTNLGSLVPTVADIRSSAEYNTRSLQLLVDLDSM